MVLVLMVVLILRVSIILLAVVNIIHLSIQKEKTERKSIHTFKP